MESFNTPDKNLIYGFFVLFFIMFILAAAAAAEIDQPIEAPESARIEQTTRLQWISPTDDQPLSFSQWRSLQPETEPYAAKLITAAATPRKAPSLGKVCVYVNNVLYPQIESSLALYALDLNGEGYDVEIHTVSGGTEFHLRSTLQTAYANGMTDCLLIGDLPVPWYEIESEGDEFPIDLFYMDLDGAFIDFDSDGMYDSHSDDVTPEITLGRLTASPLSLGGAVEADLVNEYFRKNHLYRSGLADAADRALVYIDDDWSGSGGAWSFDVGRAVGLRTSEFDDWVTWAPDYAAYLPQDYELIQVCVHSWPGGHSFKNPSDNWSTIYVADIFTINPRAHFYNLFACSNSRYVEADYCGGWYIFSDDYGLGSIGSAKTGSMLAFDEFYGPFGDGRSIGQAFMDWFTTRGSDGFEEWEIYWFYGMTLCGDPTLGLQKKSNNEILQFDNGAASYMMSLPGNYDLLNTRFSADKACTLSAVMVEGDFRSIPIRMYLYNSDGVYPTVPFDSVDIPDGDIRMVDISHLNLILQPGTDIHVGFRCLEAAPAETTWVYMDNASGIPDDRSGMWHDNQWKTFGQYWGAGYNLLIRLEGRGDEEPAIAIQTKTLPDVNQGENISFDLGIDGGSGSYAWEISAGTLPDNLVLDPSSGIISGTVADYGAFNFTVFATDNSDPSLTDFQHYAMTVDYLCGNANGDGAINVGDGIFVINYVFKSGPAPEPLESGDANCDGNINVGDAVYLINYVFNAGLAPCCP